jgi:hypothetical protein
LPNGKPALFRALKNALADFVMGIIEQEDTSFDDEFVEYYLTTILLMVGQDNVDAMEYADNGRHELKTLLQHIFNTMKNGYEGEPHTIRELYDSILKTAKDGSYESIPEALDLPQNRVIH